MKALILFLKGIGVGIATLVPGVSGGTMAIILGVYDRLIHSISSFFKSWKENLLFLLILGCGGATGLLLFSKLISWSLDVFHDPMIYLFLGIVLGSIPVLLKKAKSQQGKSWDLLFLPLGFLIVFLMTLQPVTIVNLATAGGIGSYIFLFFAGIITAVALILTGISTSFMLLTFGLYDLTLEAFNTLNFGYLIPLGVGTAAGVILTTKLLEALMQKHPRPTYLMILGFVLGSVVEIFPGVPKGRELPLSVIMLVLGVILITFIIRLEKEEA